MNSSNASIIFYDLYYQATVSDKGNNQRQIQVYYSANHPAAEGSTKDNYRGRVICWLKRILINLLETEMMTVILCLLEKENSFGL